MPVGVFGKENDEIVITPNPAVSTLEIQLDDSFLGSGIRISNLAGQIVLDKTADKNYEILNIRNLKKGIYIIEIRSKEKFITKKFSIY